MCGGSFSHEIQQRVAPESSKHKKGVSVARMNAFVEPQGGQGEHVPELTLVWICWVILRLLHNNHNFDQCLLHTKVRVHSRIR